MFFQNISKYLLWEIRYRKLDVKGHAALEIANTLILDTLSDFKHKTEEMEVMIDHSSLIEHDINQYREYINEINQMVRVLQLRRFRMKGEIRKLKRVSRILKSAPFTN